MDAVRASGSTFECLIPPTRVGGHESDLIEDFLDLNDIPAGPILLRDLGFDRNKFLKEGLEHKLEKAIRILSAFPRLPFVLFGDSGQEDAPLYAQAAQQRPDQVKAICIRDVDPDATSEHDAKVRKSIALAEKNNVPMYLVPDSREAANIALSHGADRTGESAVGRGGNSDRLSTQRTRAVTN